MFIQAKLRNITTRRFAIPHFWISGVPNLRERRQELEAALEEGAPGRKLGIAATAAPNLASESPDVKQRLRGNKQKHAIANNYNK